jgi:hypothetical protein
MTPLILAGLLAALTDATPLPTLAPQDIRTQVAALAPEARQALLSDAYEKKVTLQMSDEQLAAMMDAMGAEVRLNTAFAFLAKHNTYEVIVTKQERIDGKLNEGQEVDRTLVRIREKPKAVYMKWLKGGRHVGQELIFDAVTTPKQFRVRPDGVFGVLAYNIDLDSRLAHEESIHLPGDYGFGGLLGFLNQDRIKLEKAGLPTAPVSQKSAVHRGIKCWENVYLTPGRPAYSADKARFLYDLTSGQPLFAEVYDKNGVLWERYDYEEVRWAPLPANAFDKKNPAYDF